MAHDTFLTDTTVNPPVKGKLLEFMFMVAQSVMILLRLSIETVILNTVKPCMHVILQ